MAQAFNWSSVRRASHVQEPILGLLSPHPVDAVRPAATEHARPIATVRDRRLVAWVMPPVMEVVSVSLFVMPDPVQVRRF